MITFVVGERRSGTSLVRAILGSHKDIYMPPNDYNLLSLIDNKPTKFGKLSKWNLDWKALDISLLQCRNDKEVINAIVDNFYRGNGRFRVIKRPVYEMHHRTLDNLFKDTKYIYILRDPRSVIASRKFYPDGKLQWKSIDRVINLSNHWIESYNAYISITKPKIVVKYETLISNPKKEIKRMCEFIGVKYSDNLLTYTDEWAKTLKSSVSKGQNYNKIYRASLDKWKDILTKEEISQIEDTCKFIMRDEGYI